MKHAGLHSRQNTERSCLPDLFQSMLLGHDYIMHHMLSWIEDVTHLRSGTAERLSMQSHQDSKKSVGASCKCGHRTIFDATTAMGSAVHLRRACLMSGQAKAAYCSVDQFCSPGTTQAVRLAIMLLSQLISQTHLTHSCKKVLLLASPC